MPPNAGSVGPECLVPGILSIPRAFGGEIHWSRASDRGKISSSVGAITEAPAGHRRSPFSGAVPGGLSVSRRLDRTPAAGRCRRVRPDRSPAVADLRLTATVATRTSRSSR